MFKALSCGDKVTNTHSDKRDFNYYKAPLSHGFFFFLNSSLLLRIDVRLPITTPSAQIFTVTVHYS